jgi:glutamate synthase domain-containing protein 2
MALNCNKAIPEADYEAEVGVPAGYCYHCHTGRCPVGVATQDPILRKRLDPDKAAERVYNFLHTLTMEASAMAMVPLAGTQHTVGRPDMTRY